MKIVSAKIMASLESQAYQQGYSEESFMEKAGAGVANEVQSFIESRQLPKNILLLCGKGNNGGDAFVAGFYLLNQHYSVTAIQLDDLDRCSPLCQKNGKRFSDQGGQIVRHLEDFSSYSLILDGLFGTGFKGQIKEPYASLIQAANQSKVPILAIDIPSGLDGSTGRIEGVVIQATETLFLGLPKTGFFLEEGWNYVGKLRYVDFGLPQEIIEKISTDLIILTHAHMSQLLPPIKRNRHKYQAGYVIGLAGSPGMPGAAILASLAALRGGSGMVHLLHPTGMEAELLASPYELIKVPYNWKDSQSILQEMQKGGATFIGPGLGRTQECQRLLREVVPFLEKPCVIDADALILLANEAFQLPKQAILTPHTGEMQRLLHYPSRLTINEELLKTCQHYVEEKKITLVLKGAPTFIFHPGHPILVNPTGDPGMATAGSGDVLTGFIASLLSQGVERREAAALGVYLHGLAGEFAAQKLTSYCMIASDIIYHFSNAYLACQIRS
jgi:hydroxyethylthiazole kinase-like uncharacterized protein yjeF